MDVETTHITNLVVTQPTTTTVLEPLPTGQVLLFTTNSGFPGPKGDDGDQGQPGQDGAAQIPEILDGGNF